uniref:Uncharacterized protein n=1 Tax=Parascaris equorum TaxID=6256 RepID=A0A914RJH9_PAREQ
MKLNSWQLQMSRKVTACGFLYVAPPNIDFSQPSHSAKVRRIISMLHKVFVF